MKNMRTPVAKSAPVVPASAGVAHRPLTIRAEALVDGISPATVHRRRRIAAEAQAAAEKALLEARAKRAAAKSAKAKTAAPRQATPLAPPAPMPDLSGIAAALAALAESQRQQGELIARLMTSAVPVAVPVPGLTAPAEQTVDPEWSPPNYDNNSILVISDLHAPYEHPDALAFLVALRDAYGFERAICTGDETDGHAISFHTSSPNLPSAGQETDMARAFMRKLEAEFPVLDVMHSNHGSLIYRRQQDGGLPDHAMQSYRGFLFGERRKDGSTFFPEDAGRRWRWHDDLEIVLPSGEKCLFVHGLGSGPFTRLDAV